MLSQEILSSLFSIILVLIKLSLVEDQQMFVFSYAGHDDRLFVSLAENILRGEWLGEYNNLTLAKGPFYPVWISMIFLLGNTITSLTTSAIHSLLLRLCSCN
jgi:hypothetical protein